jgi:hypothetical protein
MYFPSKRIRRIGSWRARVGLTYIILSILASCATGQPTSSISPSAQPATPPISPIVSTLPAQINTPLPTATSHSLGPDLRLAQPFDTQVLSTPGNTLLYGLIIFSSQAAQPFAVAGTPRKAKPAPGGNVALRLYGLAPDASYLGALSLPVPPFRAYWPVKAGERPILVQAGVYFNHPGIRSLTLPEECYGKLATEEPNPEPKLPCDGFQFSPDGAILGGFFGPQICARGLILLDSETGEKLFRSPVGSGSAFEFLSNGKVLITETHCDIGKMSLLQPGTRQLEPLGEMGATSWNPQHTALAVTLTPNGPTLESRLWVYNVELDRMVLPPQPAGSTLLYKDPQWSADGRTLAFHSRSFKRRGEKLTFDQPAQVLRLDVKTGKVTVLASKPGYDYFFSMENSKPVPGDWKILQRRSFQRVEMLEKDFIFWKGFNCIYSGINCLAGPSLPPEPELFAVNLLTGELLPLKQAPSPSATPFTTPTLPPATGPDLTEPPIYRDPDGNYALYVGLDQHSLWYVPRQGEPLVWVRDGQHFTYLSPVP